MDAFVGMVMPVGFPFAPQGWLTCQGQTLGIAQYNALYALLVTSFGGDGRTNFKLPNLQGCTPIGTGINTASGTNYTLGQAVGAPTTTLNMLNLPAHNHPAQLTLTPGTQSVTIPAVTGDLSVAVTVNATTAAGTTNAPAAATNMLGAVPLVSKLYTATTTSGTVALGGTSATVSGNASTAGQTVSLPTVTGGSVAVGMAGGSQPFSVFQPSLAMTFIIAVTGIYPVRP